MPRYTRKNLQQDLIEINKSIEHTGHYVAAQGRNGYTGLDEYEGVSSAGNSGRCIRNLQCGTPKECLLAAELYADSFTENL
jgi:hypothetical protein